MSPVGLEKLVFSHYFIVRSKNLKGKENTMGNNTLSNGEMQAQRLKIKQLDQQMLNAAVKGAGLSPWEAETLVRMIGEVYFRDSDLKQIQPGQMRYSCVAASEPPGKPIKECQIVTVTLSLLLNEDTEELPFNAKDASIETRWRRLLRICDEAREQGGLLSQEDLAKLLMSDVRTIRRDIAELKRRGIIVPTRGTVKDIGPGVTHKEIAIRLWLEGQEPTEVARRIHHSIKATENYLEKFKRVAYLRREKGFSEFEISRTVGISTAATRTFLSIYDEFKGKALFDMRMEEINLVGKAYNLAEGEKKESAMSKNSISSKRGRR